MVKQKMFAIWLKWLMCNENQNVMIVLLLQRKTIYNVWLKLCNGLLHQVMYSPIIDCVLSLFLIFKSVYLLSSTLGMWLSAFYLDIPRNRNLITLQGNHFISGMFWMFSSLYLCWELKSFFLELVPLDSCSCLEGLLDSWAQTPTF